MPLSMEARAQLMWMKGWERPKPKKVVRVAEEEDEAQMFDMGKKHEPEESWRRITLRTCRVINMAREHQVTMELQALYFHRRDPEDPDEVDEDYAQVKDSKCVKIRPSMVCRLEILSRQPMTDCQGKAHLKQAKFVNKEHCQHPVFLGKGNLHGC